MRQSRMALAPLAVAAALALAACGGSNNSSSSSNKSGSSGSSGGTAKAGEGGYANVAASQGQKKGGTLNVASASIWQHLDPGESYYQIDYLVEYAVHRPLYSFTPDSKMTPDLAAAPP